MASKLVVKAALQYPEGLELGCSPDIRRFRLSREVEEKGNLYCRLVDALGTAFPDILGVNYSLYWKDGEGDLIEFSSTEELQAAIDAMSDHVLRVYVIVHFDDIEETSEAETDGQGDAKDKGSKRVRFARAGRRFRRKVRRRRRAALSDPVVISKEFRTGARVFVRRLHQAAECPQQADSAVDELAPQVRDFIKQTHDEWHSKLTSQRPSVLCRRMRMKKRTLPSGLERDHFLWLLRLMARWHRRHAGQCRAMAGWSSGDTDADESGGEEGVLRRVRRMRKRQRRARRLAANKELEEGGGGAAKAAEEEEEEGEKDKGQHNVAREFRQAVRLLMKQIHQHQQTKTKDATTKPADQQQDKAALAALKPEVQSFVQKLAEDWHAMLAEKKPSLVAKRIRKRRRPLPADLTRDHYLWMCRYFRRWHSRHAARCVVMSGWSSGEEDDHVSEDEGEREERKGKGKGKKKEKQEKKKKEEESSSESSSSESDDDKKKKKAVPKAFVKATRVLVNRLHGRKVPSKDDTISDEEDSSAVAAMSPEVQAFVRTFAEEWDRKLARKSPLLVAKRMKRKERKLPAGMTENHFRFLCRFLSRWHGKHAAFCSVMGAWSSGESGGETSGGEETAALKRRARRAALLDVSSASEQEDTDCVETACKPVSKEFRTGVRQWLNQLHRKPPPPPPSGKQQQPKAKDEKEKTTLSPEVQQFLQRFAEAWHGKVISSRPRAVSREMKAAAGSVSLPSRMEREQYTWLCCFMARWHRKNAARCDVLSDAAAGGQGEGAKA
ncbi:uncharacterized protein LOC143286720 [Babylonia areolata]|uniref:uncharacterized protein LOC143286720 n=1 Tax=Babylonia areolata TaxID=304850 RepID=UPI003FD2F13C